MGREIRRVPANWEHPKDADDHYQPMHDKPYIAGIIDHIRYELPWYLKHPSKLGEFFEEWPNDPAYYRPARLRATHYQVYETVSEGTPVSPVFATLDELTDWVVAQGYSREAAEAFARDGWVPSLAFVNGTIYKDIEIKAIPKE